MKSRALWSGLRWSLAFTGLALFLAVGVVSARGEGQAVGKTDGVKKIVFLAGGPSHGFGAHEHKAGCLLLAKWLSAGVPGVKTVVESGWPKDPSVLQDADTIVIFCDGGGGHLAMPHLKDLDALMKKGIGLVCLHYGVEIPKGEPGNYFLDWIGGYFETNWSVNPHWTAEYKSFPDHPITRGVKPFTINDEWYYHMRFPEGMKGVTPILTAVPPDSTRQGGDSTHGGNPTVRAEKGHAEHLAWALQRPDGGRGFGFTGAHNHWEWGCDSFRTVVLNGILWTAHGQVPAGGVPSKTPTVAELVANQDEPTPANFDEKRIEKQIEEWNGKK